MTINIYTDGSCLGNPGPGGWAVVFENTAQIHAGSVGRTTNNRMELQAAIEAVAALISQGQGNEYCINTDSEYVKNGITQWIEGWKRKGWKTANRKQVANRDLWQRLDKLVQDVQQHGIKLDWDWVKGHSDNPGNDRADTTAQRFAVLAAEI